MTTINDTNCTGDELTNLDNLIGLRTMKQDDITVDDTTTQEWRNGREQHSNTSTFRSENFNNTIQVISIDEDGEETSAYVKLTYDDYKMRRKAETLQHRNNEYKINNRQKFSDVVKNGGKYRGVSNARLLRLISSNQCNSTSIIINNSKRRPAYHSGINMKQPDNVLIENGVEVVDRGLYFDKQIPYYSTI